MVLQFLRCCISPQPDEVKESSQAVNSEGGKLGSSGLHTTPAAQLSPSAPVSCANGLHGIVQELLVRLPQVSGNTWLSRLEASTALLSSLAGATATSVALVAPTDDEHLLPCYASTLAVGGPRGAALLTHQQQQGYLTALIMAAASRGAGPPAELITSLELLMSGQHGDVLLLPASTNGPAPRYHSKPGTHLKRASSLQNTSLASIITASCSAALPADWVACAEDTDMRHFCGLPVRVGPRLCAVITLAWAADCPVPPGLRGLFAAGATNGTKPTTMAAHTAPRCVLQCCPGCGAAGCGGTGEGLLGPDAAAPPTEAERACLLQLSQMFGLGLFGDPSCLAYGEGVARMLQLMMCADTLQGVLDVMASGIRDALLHRCQLDVSATLALAHLALPTAAFVVDCHTTALTASPAQAPPGYPSQASLRKPSKSAANSLNGYCSGGSAAVAPAGTASCAHVQNAGSHRLSALGVISPSLCSGCNPAPAAGAVSGTPLSPLSGGGVAATTSGCPAQPCHGPAGRASACPAGGGAVSSASAVFRTAVSMEFNCIGSSLEPGTEGGGGLAHSIQAHISPLAHTLLLSSLALGPDPDDATHLGPGGGTATSSASNLDAARHGPPSSWSRDWDSPGPRRNPASGSYGLGRTGGAGGGGGGGGSNRTLGAVLASNGGGGGSGDSASRLGGAGLTAQGCVIANCHLYLQEESLPCRDVVLVQKLTRSPVRALALVLVRPGEAVGAAGCAGGEGAGSGTGAAGGEHVEGVDRPLVHHHAPAGPHGSSVASDLPTLALYLTSSDPLTRVALQRAQVEARDIMRLAMGVLCHRLTHGSLLDEWVGLMEALAAPSGLGFGSTRLVSLLRPKSSNLLHQQVSGDLLGFNSVPSRSHLQGLLSGELSRSLATPTGGLPGGGYGSVGTCGAMSATRSGGLGPLGGGSCMVLDSSAEQPLQQLDALVGSIQSTLSLSAQMRTLEEAGSKVRLNDIAAVEMIEIIGRGGQGVVFRGTVHGIEAAVKVISHKDEVAEGTDPRVAGSAVGREDSSVAAAAANSSQDSPCVLLDEARMRQHKRGLLRDALELAVTSTISHPNIVQMYGYFTDCVVVQYVHNASRLKLLPADSEDLQEYGAGQRGPLNTVMCMEYCDAGTLKSAAESGAFRQPGVSAKSGPACPALVPLYTSLLELALVLRHLHGRRLVHGDLKPSNVLLKSSLRDPRGWTCKLSDFGCVRLMSEELEDGRLGFRQPQPLGTLTHMAPEMFVRGGFLDGAIDIYSFGIIMWELIMVAPLYDSMIPKEKLPSLVRRGLRPAFHPLVPNEYRVLASACWLDDPRRRPSAATLVISLQRLLRRAQAAAAAATTHLPGHTAGARSLAKSSSMSSSGVGPVSNHPPAQFTQGTDVDPHSIAVAAAAAAGNAQRNMYGSAPGRRNTVSSNLGAHAAGHGGSGGHGGHGAHGGGGGGGAAVAATLVSSGASQRHSLQPVCSPLSREAGRAARAAVRVGEGGCGKPLRLQESVSPGGSAVGGVAGPLGAGLGGPGPAAGGPVAPVSTNAAVVSATSAGPDDGRVSPVSLKPPATFPALQPGAAAAGTSTSEMRLAGTSHVGAPPGVPRRKPSVYGEPPCGVILNGGDSSSGGVPADPAATAAEPAAAPSALHLAARPL